MKELKEYMEYGNEPYILLILSSIFLFDFWINSSEYIFYADLNCDTYFHTASWGKTTMQLL
jgi:hypothetical protein